MLQLKEFMKPISVPVKKNIPVLIIRSKHQEQQNADWVHM